MNRKDYSPGLVCISVDRKDYPKAVKDSSSIKSLK